MAAVGKSVFYYLSYEPWICPLKVQRRKSDLLQKFFKNEYCKSKEVK